LKLKAIRQEQQENIKLFAKESSSHNGGVSASLKKWHVFLVR
jgi:hypothetical protein